MERRTWKEKWRLRLEQWVAVLRWWQAELWVRIVLARCCVAIYKRELAVRRCEAADIEAYRAKENLKEMGLTDE